MQWGLLVYGALILLLIILILVVSHLTGERNRGRATRQPYEAGMPPTGSARLRLRASYYLVAMLFVIFDLEAAFVYVWAVSVRQTGWAGYLEMLVFVAVLAVGLVYLWRTGALDWGPWARRRSGGGTEGQGAP